MLELEDLLEEQQALINYSISANPSGWQRRGLHLCMVRLEEKIAVASLKLEKKESMLKKEGLPVPVELIEPPYTKYPSISEAARSVFMNTRTLHEHFNRHPTTPYMGLIPSVNKHLI